MLTSHKEGDSRRVIVDLSFGDGAVNKVTEKGTYEGQDVSLKLPSLDHLVEEILRLDNPMLVKADISRAFRSIPCPRKYRSSSEI